MKKLLKDYILYVVVFAFIAVCYVISNTQNNNDISDTSVLLNGGWTLDYDGVVTEDYSFVSKRFPLTNKGDRLIFTTFIPDDIPINPVLCFRTVHSDIAVFIDGKEIYAYGQADYDKGRYVSSGSQFIDMKSDYAGKKLSVVLRVSENHAFSSLESPYIADSNYLHRDYIKRHQV